MYFQWLTPLPARQPHAITRGMKRLFAALIALTLLSAAGLSALSFMRFSETIHLAAPRTVFIEAGTGKKAILNQLHGEGLTPPWWMTMLPLMASGNPSLKAGEYAFEGSITPAEVLDAISGGKVVVHKITLPEGWNIRQLADALRAEDLLTGELPVLEEGHYLPETYHFHRGEPRADVLKRMRDAMEKELDRLWGGRAPDVPVASPQEALILASIIERETGLDNERGTVASVYSNRLRIAMPLQADPTVAYGIEQAQKVAMTRPLTRADLARDHAWNTYTRSGLPATPIANPGKESIAAALNPPKTNYLYFVATGDGGHIFAATLAEHNRNVAAYRKKLRTKSKS